MFTIRNIRSSHAKHYYEAEALQAGEWLGAGKEELKLKGKVYPESFNALLDRQLIQIPSSGHRRVGYDLCFSADKSISLLGLVAQRADVIQAITALSKRP